MLHTHNNRWMFIYDCIYAIATQHKMWILWLEIYWVEKQRILCKKTKQNELKITFAKQKEEKNEMTWHSNRNCSTFFCSFPSFSRCKCNHKIVRLFNKSIFFILFLLIEIYNNWDLVQQNEFFFLFYCGFNLIKINRSIMQSSAHTHTHVNIERKNQPA